MANTTEPCSLSIAGRVVARSESGPFEAEYALFEAESIELKRMAPQTVREVGYRTTAQEALERLEALGVTEELTARACAAMRPGLAEVYARGPVVRRVIDKLGARELFDGRVYSATGKTYEGTWLDLRVLATELGVGAGAGLQLLFLRALLAEVDPAAEVFLSTLPLAEQQRPGFRSYRRVSLAGVEMLPERLAELAERAPGELLHDTGPSRVEVLDEIGHSHAISTDAAKARLSEIERATGMLRPPPQRGPMSDPVAWSIEAQITSGDLVGAMARIDAVERSRGMQPSLVYLRSRASLLLAREQPRVIAERVSKLAAKASFAELELLAAQAWAAAGEMGRALPYAQMLMQGSNVDEDVRTAATRIVRAAERGEASLPPVDGASAPPVRRERPTTRAPELPPRRSHRSPSGSSPLASRPSTPAHAWAHIPSEAPTPRPATALAFDEIPATPRVSVPERSLSPLPAVLEPSLASSRPPPPDDAADSESGVHLSARPAADSLDLDVDIPRDPRRVPTEAPPPETPSTWMRGASRPALRAVARRSTPPHFCVGMADLAETLRDPALALLADEVPHLDVRRHHTGLSRELGRLYRTQLGVELRVDVASVEAMQAELLQRYGATGVRTAAAAEDVRRHGAFLSEILARTLEGQWVDVSAPDVGHWVMALPREVHVWPFGRVLRLIATGYRERDLVSYYLELCARAS